MTQNYSIAFRQENKQANMQYDLNSCILFKTGKRINQSVLQIKLEIIITVLVCLCTLNVKHLRAFLFVAF